MSEKNNLSKQIGIMKAKKTDASEMLARVEKIKKELQNKSGENEYLIKKMDRYGKLTWSLFYFQIGLFCLATISFIIAFLMIYHNKLF